MVKGRRLELYACAPVSGRAGTHSGFPLRAVCPRGMVYVIMLAVLGGAAVSAQEAPTIDYFTPTGGPEGTVVFLYGAHFDVLTAGNTTVIVDGKAVEMVFVKESEIIFTIPAGGTTGLIAVTTPAGTVTSAEPFVVSPLTISIAPSRLNAAVGTERPLSALVTGGSNSDVLWQVNGIEGGNSEVGTVTQANPTAYSAPGTVPDPATVRVTAVCAANPQVMAHARVTVFSMLAGVPDLELGPLRLNEFSRDPETGLMMGRMRIIVVMAEGASTADLAVALGPISGQVTAGLPETETLMVEIPDTGNLDAVKSAAAALQEISGVEVAVPDTVLEMQMLEPEEAGTINLYAGNVFTKYDANLHWSWEIDPYGSNWGLEYANFRRRGTGTTLSVTAPTVLSMPVSTMVGPCSTTMTISMAI